MNQKNTSGPKRKKNKSVFAKPKTKNMSSFNCVILLLTAVLIGGFLYFGSEGNEKDSSSILSQLLTGELLTGAAVSNGDSINTEKGITPLGDIGITADANSTSCGTVNGNITLTSSLSTTVSCLTINKSNAIIDCAGFSINGDGGAGDRAIVNSGGFNNLLVKNCILNKFGGGVFFLTLASNYSTIQNNTFNNTINGISMGNTVRFTIIANNSFISFAAGSTSGVIFSGANGAHDINITNNTFVGDFGTAAINIPVATNNNNQVWGNWFFASDGVINSGTNTSFCIGNVGNFYNGSVLIAQVPGNDCGPTPNGTVNVKHGVATSFTWGGTEANYTDLRTAIYNLGNVSGNNIAYMLADHNTTYSQSSNAVETVRNNTQINCLGHQFRDTTANSAIGGIVVNGEIGISVMNCTINDFDSGMYIANDGEVSIYNNSFIAGGELYGIRFVNGDNSNVTNNTFDGNYGTAGISFDATTSNNNKVWRNKFIGGSGIVNTGTNTSVCFSGLWGNYYNGSVAIAQVLPYDCGPTPNGIVNVKHGVATSFTWGGTEANYTDLRTAVYNLNNTVGMNTAYMLTDHNTSYAQSSNAVETVRNNTQINCLGRQFRDTASNSAIGGIVVNGEIGISVMNCTINDFDSGMYIANDGEVSIYNNSFIAGGELYGVRFVNGDNSNVTNNTFDGNYGTAGISFDATTSNNNNVWRNLFLGSEGITDSGTNTSLCLPGLYGNYYNATVAAAQVLSRDCGPTPNSPIYVNSSVTQSTINISSSSTANNVYNTLQHAYYNLNGNQTIYLLDSVYLSRALISGTIRDWQKLDCQNNLINGTANPILIDNDDWNTVQNCRILTTGASSVGISLVTAVNTQIINTTINTSGASAYGIQFQTGAENNSIINSTFNVAPANDVRSTSTNNNSIINCQINRSDLGVITGGYLTVQWYLWVNVTTGILPLGGAEINAYNISNVIEQSGLTDSGGLFSTILTEFIQYPSAAAKNYSTPHNITANLTGYGSNSTIINLSLTNSTAVTFIFFVPNSAPTQGTPILNSTNPLTNDTNQNLTVYNQSTADVDGNGVKNIIDWRVNGTSIAWLNMPFEGGSNDTWTKNYALGKNGTVVNATWSLNGGHDGKGAYEFNGSSANSITISAASDFSRGGTVVAWINPKNITNTQGLIHSRVSGGGAFLVHIQAGALNAMYYNGSDNIGKTNGSIALDQWSHFAWAFNGTEGWLYINGVLQQQESSRAFTSSGGSTTVLGTFIDNYLNGTLDEMMIFNRSLSSQEITVLYQNRTDLIVAEETTVGENWTAMVTPNDGMVDGAAATSNWVVIASSAVSLTAPALVSPNDGNHTLNHTPTFIWNNSVGGAGTTYNIVIDNNNDFSSPEVNVSSIAEGTTQTNYTLGTELTVDTPYFWKVQGNSGGTLSSWSSTFNLTVDSYLAVSAIQNTINFGTLAGGETANTSTNSPFPFLIENAGNVFVNITVTGTPIFQRAAFPSDYFKFKINQNETGAYVNQSSTFDWTTVTNVSTRIDVFNFDWHDENDTFENDLWVTIPGNEPGGTRNSTLTFTAS